MRLTGAVSDLGEVLEVTGDLTSVPGAEDRLDVREVLVERRATDTGLLGDLLHRHGSQPALGDERCGHVDDRVAHLPAVLLDRVVPEHRHRRRIRRGVSDT